MATAKYTDAVIYARNKKVLEMILRRVNQIGTDFLKSCKKLEEWTRDDRAFYSREVNLQILNCVQTAAHALEQSAYNALNGISGHTRSSLKEWRRCQALCDKLIERVTGHHSSRILGDLFKSRKKLAEYRKQLFTLRVRSDSEEERSVDRQDVMNLVTPPPPDNIMVTSIRSDPETEIVKRIMQHKPSLSGSPTSSRSLDNACLKQVFQICREERKSRSISPSQPVFEEPVDMHVKVAQSKDMESSESKPSLGIDTGNIMDIIPDSEENDSHRDELDDFQDDFNPPHIVESQALPMPISEPNEELIPTHQGEVFQDTTISQMDTHEEDSQQRSAIPEEMSLINKDSNPDDTPFRWLFGSPGGPLQQPPPGSLAPSVAESLEEGEIPCHRALSTRRAYLEYQAFMLMKEADRENFDRATPPICSNTDTDGKDGLATPKSKTCTNIVSDGSDKPVPTETALFTPAICGVSNLLTPPPTQTRFDQEMLTQTSPPPALPSRASSPENPFIQPCLEKIYLIERSANPAILADLTFNIDPEEMAEIEKGKNNPSGPTLLYAGMAVKLVCHKFGGKEFEMDMSPVDKLNYPVEWPPTSQASGVFFLKLNNSCRNLNHRTTDNDGIDVSTLVNVDANELFIAHTQPNEVKDFTFALKICKK